MPIGTWIGGENVGKIIISFGAPSSAGYPFAQAGGCSQVFPRRCSKPLAERVHELTAQALGLAVDEITP